MDVICLGELLIDFIGNESGVLKEISSFQKYPGGAAANVAVGVKRLGIDSLVITKVGDDPFGDYLINNLMEYDVDTSLVFKDRERKTGIVFVSLDENKVPEYFFYRDNCASMHLNGDDIRNNIDKIKDGKVLYFSSMSLVNQPFKDSNYTAVKIAKKTNTLVAFDPNVRITLWESKSKAIDEISKMVEYIDILKINEEELNFLFSLSATDDFVEKIFAKHSNLKLLCLTLGKNGTIISNGSNKIKVPSFKVVETDTTGAGDAFMSALLYFIIIIGKNNFSFDLLECGRFANAAAAFCIKNRGVISALPTKEDIKNIMRN